MTIPKNDEELKDFFSDKNRVKNQYIKFNQINDFFMGTLTDIREVDSILPGKEGQKVKIYEFISKVGQFHELNDKKQIIEEPVLVQENEFYLVSGKPIIDNQMRKAKIGQIVGMKYEADKAPKQKGFNPLKIISVYLGGMDEVYAGQMSQDLEAKVRESGL